MNWYMSLPRRKQIIFCVFLAHGILLVMLGADHWMQRPKVQRKKVTVNTVVFTDPPKIEASSPPKTATTPSPKKPTAKPQVKKLPPAPQKKAKNFYSRKSSKA